MTGNPEPEKGGVFRGGVTMAVAGLVEHDLVALKLVVSGIDGRRLAGRINETAAHKQGYLNHGGKVDRVKVAHDLIMFSESLAA